ncbi:MAG: Rpn family recombination-promoting nuclease/putative transposase, partial [Deltaproteobacteria bacterium]|nr:Rpn family recombination-promoting nuclease/putative transposase [Deltaproteobacteria bacterium]
WNFKLNPVYCVAILDFVFGDDRPQKDYFNNVQLKDQYCQLFYDKLTYIFLEMPRFQKTEQELETHFDKWLYFLKHLESFEDIPDILKEDVFLKGFEIAELSNFDARQIDAYERSLMSYRDLKGAFDTSYEEGMEEGHKTGLEEGQNKEKQETARRMKAKGYSIGDISELTGLSPDTIGQL